MEGSTVTAVSCPMIRGCEGQRELFGRDSEGTGFLGNEGPVRGHGTKEFLGSAVG